MSTRLLSQRGQAAILLVAGCLVVFAGVAAFAQYGTAFLARGRLQRAVDLAGLAAAQSMSRDFSRLMSPASMPDGSPNPAHISRTTYLDRARAAARRSLELSRVAPRQTSFEFPVGAAPTVVTVTIARDRHLALPAGDGRAERVTLRAAATARLAFEFGAMPGVAQARASGGGYSGPLAYRQGKPMRPDVATAFDRLQSSARASGHSLLIASAFRSDAEQARIFAQRPDPKWVAPPGTSLHRYATELDLGPPSAYGWLAANARRFGFIKRYAWEAWHWGFSSNPRDVPAQYERGSFEPRHGRFDGAGGLPAYVPARFAATIARAAQRHNVQPELLAAQLQAESGFNPSAVSPAGAQGIAQFMPATARAVGLRDPFDPEQAIDAQARLMSAHLRRFGTIPKALAAYNAGPGAVERYNGVPAFPETQSYIARILALMKSAGVELNDPAFAGISVTPRAELIR
ncbi:MAG: transglycosylase SLT domain-containing protein [Actinobacteria bacterium]|nr:transglycosylase SLT domain-containing protein [Actinomycetota bacterium]